MVIPEEAIMNSAVFTPKFEITSPKSINSKNGSNEIISREDMEIGKASDIHKIRHAASTPTARSCSVP